MNTQSPQSGLKQFSSYQERRKELIERVRAQHPKQEGLIVFFAGFERECTSFKQESSFYYYTGLTEPGLVMVLDVVRDTSTLYVPNCGTQRDTWMFSPVSLTPENAGNLGFNAIEPLGAVCASYQFHPFFPREEYQYVVALLAQCVKEKKAVFTLSPDNASEYADQRLLLERLKLWVPGLQETIQDIAPIVAAMRRKKTMPEIERMYKAVELTALAQEVAMQVITPGITECEVQAGIEYIFTGSCARPSFPSIVATGKNATILHYTLNNATMQAGELVVIDIGAQVDYYCADITRTYPVSGTFTARQRELYQAVLDTQEYIATLAKPGMWLSNKDKPQQSLHHLAHEFLQKRDLSKYFLHGIGHFLGIDVHDVGDRKEPLQPGDVITIEPGVYLREEGIGIRIEDDYWMVEDGAVCLSEYIPKTIAEVESIMQEFAGSRGK